MAYLRLHSQVLEEFSREFCIDLYQPRKKGFLFIRFLAKLVLVRTNTCKIPWELDCVKPGFHSVVAESRRAIVGSKHTMRSVVEGENYFRYYWKDFTHQLTPTMELQWSSPTVGDKWNSPGLHITRYKIHHLRTLVASQWNHVDCVTVKRNAYYAVILCNIPSEHARICIQCPYVTLWRITFNNIIQFSSLVNFIQYEYGRQVVACQEIKVFSRIISMSCTN
jgi:hypothetical protein